MSESGVHPESHRQISEQPLPEQSDATHEQDPGHRDSAGDRPARVAEAPSPKTPAESQDSAYHPVAASSSLLAALRQGNDSEREAALRKLYELLLPHARGKISGSSSRRSDQAESVVQSVIVHEIAGRDLDQVKDDQHLEARLKRAVKNKVIDRFRRRRAAGVVAGSDGERHAVDHGEGPGTKLAGRESLLLKAERLRAFHDVVNECPLSKTQRAIVQMAVVEDHPLQRVAEECGTTVPTVKVRLTEARKRLVPHLLEPLRHEVDGQTWAVIELLLIRRRRPERCAEVLGMDHGQIRRVMREEVYPRLHRLYGGEGILLVERLLGNRRA